jgi:hypothetical protein
LTQGLGKISLRAIEWTSLLDMESESLVSITLDDVGEDSLGQFAHGVLHVPGVETGLHSHSLSTTVVRDSKEVVLLVKTFTSTLEEALELLESLLLLSKDFFLSDNLNSLLVGTIIFVDFMFFLSKLGNELINIEVLARALKLRDWV